LSCGSCASGQLCDSTHNCATCTKNSCSGTGTQCGSLDDGCGGKWDCGACAVGYQCQGGKCNACGPTCDLLPCGVCVTDSCGNSVCSCQTGCGDGPPH
jgi:hypothetical protein